MRRRNAPRRPGLPRSRSRARRAARVGSRWPPSPHTRPPLLQAHSAKRTGDDRGVERRGHLGLTWTNDAPVCAPPAHRFEATARSPGRATGRRPYPSITGPLRAMKSAPVSTSIVVDTLGRGTRPRVPPDLRQHGHGVAANRDACGHRWPPRPRTRSRSAVVRTPARNRRRRAGGRGSQHANCQTSITAVSVIGQSSSAKISSGASTDADRRSTGLTADRRRASVSLRR